MIIPIGVDCGMTDFIKKYKLRDVAFPFDWNVTFNGVSQCIDNDFKDFTEPLNNRINKYDVYFHHEFNDSKLINQDKDKYIRRCERLINVLENSKEEITFCRKGHRCHNHDEHPPKFHTITNDIDDAEKLDMVLQKKYPSLNYKIIVILNCNRCFKCDVSYKSNSKNIDIHNIVTISSQDDPSIFENVCRTIFKV